jgi:hypothetical protein
MKKPIEKLEEKVKALPNSSVKEKILKDIDIKKGKTVTK